MRHSTILAAAAASVFIFGIDASTIAAAATTETVIGTRSFSVDQTIVDSNGIKGRQYVAEDISLSPGEYTVKMVFSAFVDSSILYRTASAFTSIEGYPTAGGIGLELGVISQQVYSSTVGEIVKSVNFTMPDINDFRWFWVYGADAPGVTNYTVTLSKVSVTAVPGPEAGAGLGALAMLGVAYWAKRRRGEKALAA